MMLINKYRLSSKIIHWIVAITVICLLFVGFSLDSLSKDMKPTAIMVHESMGLSIAALMILRIFLIIKTPHSIDISTQPSEKFLNSIAIAVHYTFYCLLILMPLSGWMMVTAKGYPVHYFNLLTVTFPGIIENGLTASLFFKAHQTIALILIAMIILHVVGAMKHYFWNKDTVVQKMLFSK
jgi:cytochrome b561